MPEGLHLEKNPGFFSDLLRYITRNRKWWMVPIVLVLLGIGGLLALGGTAAAPFIYSLF